MKRIAVALSLVALSAYGIGCEKPVEKPAVKVETTPEGGAKVEHTDAHGETTTTEVKPTEEKPAAETPATETPAAAPAEEKPADKPAEEKPADEKPAEEKPAEEKPAN